jgi:hypothetical protein
MLAAEADALEMPAYQASAAEVGLDAVDVRRRAGPEAKLHFILRPAHPDLAGGTETVEAARRLKAVNPAGIAFYNYGHVRLAGLAHAKAAIEVLAAP